MHVLSLVLTTCLALECDGARRRIKVERRPENLHVEQDSSNVFDTAHVFEPLIELKEFATLFLTLNSEAAYHVTGHGRSFFTNHLRDRASNVGPRSVVLGRQSQGLVERGLRKRPRWLSAVSNAVATQTVEKTDADSDVVQQLKQATQDFKELVAKWESLPVVSEYIPEVMIKREEYVQRDTELRNSLKTCALGDPAETSSVSRHKCNDVVTCAHTDATRAIFEAELAHYVWEVKCMDAITAADTTAPPDPQLQTAYVNMAILKIRMFDLDGAYDYIQRAAALGSEDSRLDLLTRYCAQLRAPRSSDFMTGADLSVGSEAEKLLQGIKRVFLDANYYTDGILKATKAERMSQFVLVDNKAELLEKQLLESAREPSVLEPEGEQKRESLPANLVVLIRLFLLHRVLPLSRISLLFGPEALKLLLRLQVIRAIEGSACRMVAPDEAIAAVDADANSCGGFLSFSAIAMWPVEDDLIIATDFEQTYSTEDLEPVMYVSEDSSALLSAAPREPPVERLLDVCAGSGVQGIVGLRYYAKTCAFADLNPRAFNFIKFNLAMNSLADRASGFYEGSVYEALPAGFEPFDAIVANPPFVPNPDGIASGAGAMYGNGGNTGEQVLSALVSGAHKVLKPGGRLSTVAMAPNVEELPKRVEEWWSSEAPAVGCEGFVYHGSKGLATRYQPTSNDLELTQYQRALTNLGIVTISEMLLILRVDGTSPRVSMRGDPRHELWYDDEFLKTTVSKALSLADSKTVTPAQEALRSAAEQAEEASRAEVEEAKAKASEVKAAEAKAAQVEGEEAQDGALAALAASKAHQAQEPVPTKPEAAVHVHNAKEADALIQNYAQKQKAAAEEVTAKAEDSMSPSIIISSDEGTNFTGIDFKEIQVEWLPKAVPQDEVFASLEQRGVLGSRLDKMVKYTELALDVGESLPDPTRLSILKKVREVYDWSKASLSSAVLEAKVAEVDAFMGETVKSKHTV